MVVDPGTVDPGTLDIKCEGGYIMYNSALCPYRGRGAEGSVVRAEAVYVGILTADVGYAPRQRPPQTVGWKDKIVKKKGTRKCPFFIFGDPNGESRWNFQIIGRT